jgi:hypothetical protein
MPQSRERNPAASNDFAVNRIVEFFRRFRIQKEDLQSGEVAGCFAKPVLSEIEGLNSPQDESAVADMTEYF